MAKSPARFALNFFLGLCKSDPIVRVFLGRPVLASYLLVNKTIFLNCRGRSKNCLHILVWILFPPIIAKASVNLNVIFETKIWPMGEG